MTRQHACCGYWREKCRRTERLKGSKKGNSGRANNYAPIKLSPIWRRPVELVIPLPIASPNLERDGRHTDYPFFAAGGAVGAGLS